MIRIAVLSCIASLAGSSIGSSLSLLVSEKVLEGLMIVVLPVVAYYVMRNKNLGSVAVKEPLPDKAMLVVAVLAAFFVGGYDGFYGPGTGTFLILILTGAACMDVRRASALTKVINLSSNVAALVTFLVNGTVLYGLGLVAGAVSYTHLDVYKRQNLNLLKQYCPLMYIIHKWSSDTESV